MLWHIEGAHLLILGECVLLKRCLSSRRHRHHGQYCQNQSCQEKENKSVIYELFVDQSDSEYMAGQLSAYGYGLIDSPNLADLWLINT